MCADIVRDYSISRSPNLQELHRTFIKEVLKATPDEGWPEPAKAGRGNVWRLQSQPCTHASAVLRRNVPTHMVLLTFLSCALYSITGTSQSICPTTFARRSSRTISTTRYPPS